MLAGLAAVSLAGAARADVISERPDSVVITAYRDAMFPMKDDDWADYWEEYWDDWSRDWDEDDGLVLVTETRTVDIPAGRAKISFRGVAAGIIAQTAAVEGLPSAMLERNQDYDLLTPAALIDKSIGKQVRLARTNRISGEVTEEVATVRSGPSGTVLDYGDGRVEAVGCSGWPERLVFEDLPAGLSDKATLSVITDAPRAERRQLRVTYLALGVKWGADYVVQLSPDGRTLDMVGWITLANRSDTTFADAKMEVLAGQVSRDSDTLPPDRSEIARSARCWPLDTTTHGKPPLRYINRETPAAPPYYEGGDNVEALIVTAQKREESIEDVPLAILARVSDLADYKLYTMPVPVTLAPRQKKQVMMFHQPDVPFERHYTLQLEEPDEEARVETVLRLQNKPGSKLGLALPAGTVRLMQRGGPALVLVGEDYLADSPIGLPIELSLDTNSGILATTTEVKAWEVKRGDEGFEVTEYEVALVNERPETVEVELRFSQTGARPLVSSSRRHRNRNGELTWTIKLGPGERETMRYAFEERSW